MVEFLGFLLIIAGCVLFAFAWRGRLVNTHPHCRGCGFDLDGLSLEQTPNCPECGRLITTSKAAIRYGKRQSRRWLGAFACVVLLLGFSGMAWKPISRVSGLSNVNWYEHLPEPMLVSMATDGNTEALDTLHARLIPGEVSEEALDSLIDHAMAMLENESVVWDERWGDVLLYAFITDDLEDDELVTYARSSVQVSLEFKDQISNEETHLSFIRSLRRARRGMWSYHFRESLIQGGFAQGSTRDIQSEHTLILDRVLLKSDSELLMDSEYLSLNRGQSESQWVPFSSVPNVSTGQGVRLPGSEPGQQVVTVEYHFTLARPTSQNLQWISSASKPVTRSENPVYADFVADREILKEQLAHIQISDLLIPIDPKAIKQSGEGGTIRGIFEIYNQTKPPIGLCGKVVFQSGTKRLPFGTAWFRPTQDSGMGVHSVTGYPNRWFEYFIEHASFWDQVHEAGEVDVIIVPDYELAERYLQLSSSDRIIDHAVIFRDVPVQFYEAISNAPWDPNSPRDMAMTGRRSTEVGVVLPELLAE